jgi:hypothetical protein
MTRPAPLFVLLYHDQAGSAHWDLMIDRGTALATWQLLDPPETLAVMGGSPIRARRLADHRRIYLDYEGPVSEDRGHVRRIDRGECLALEASPTSWTIRLIGRVLRGTFVLSRIEDDRWELGRTAADG